MVLRAAVIQIATMGAGRMIIKVRLTPKETNQKPLVGTIEVRGPCDTGSIVTTITGFVVGTFTRLLPTDPERFEIVVERSVYEKYRNEGWKNAY